LRELDRQRSKKNAEQKRECARLYRQSNADKIKESRRRTYLENRQRELERAAARRRANPQAHREGLKRWRKSEKGRAWRAANRERINLDSHERRARLSANGGKFTPAEWISLKAHYGYKCLACGKGEPEIKLTPDHIVPVSKGGLNAAENIQPLCGSCNSSKKDKTIDYRPRGESARPVA
jgi:5-methylcytosine-specific restriction endonuclease McrA